MNKFEDPVLVKAYESLTASFFMKDKILYLPSGERSTSNKAAELFWMGFDGVHRSGGWDSDAKRSIGYAYWRAGQDAVKLRPEKLS
ncbi:hypothetical protein KY495_17530 [Massilia sp. PAMC28688]|uniref:hypothetical protein n=1 Tax=Massilia sp. PAMC28688 TaxID=2861283 RepID=UPI001C637124|nr:hypothetical protein [Massilia sp. PAMC28688]QYF92530.1 hypothetical protein KY495_17530 [Massilia sp. PAMC28688]